MELYLSQLEFADRQPEEEPLSLQVDARLPGQNIAANLGFVTLAPGSDSDASVGEGSIVRRDETLGSRTYDLTLFLGVEPDMNEAYLNVPNRIESLSLAEGFGVVAIERTDVGPLYLNEVIRAAPDR